MSIKELISLLQDLQNQIGSSSGEDVLASHDSKPFVKFVVYDKITDDETYLSLEEISVAYRVGCFCPEGIVFVFDKKD